MDIRTNARTEERLETWHPGGIIVNLILVSVAVSFVAGNVALIAAIVFIGRP